MSKSVLLLAVAGMLHTVQGLVITRPTGTNVNDVAVVLPDR